MTNTIEEFAEDRGVKSLFHFTREKNLDSILKYGLLRRSKAEERGATVNDSSRYDGTDAACATISFPNYKMFYRLRCENRPAEWVVLALKHSLMWETKCAFCASNAASSGVTEIPLDKRIGLVALKKMFDDFDGKERSGLSIPRHYTTNPQAEVLLLDGAPASAIKMVYFETRATMERYQNKYPGLKAQLNGGYFDGRSDSNHWKN